jgi:hypothetical protein
VKVVETGEDWRSVAESRRSRLLSDIVDRLPDMGGRNFIDRVILSYTPPTESLQVAMKSSFTKRKSDRSPA